MVDTIRSLPALQTLLADNTTGAISAQAFRDFLVSVYPGWYPTTAGEYDDLFITDNSGNWTTVAPDTGSVTWSYQAGIAAARGLQAQPVDVTVGAGGDLGAYLKALTGITTGDYIQTVISTGGPFSTTASGFLVFTDGTTSAANVVGVGVSYSSAFSVLQSVEGTLTAATLSADLAASGVRGYDNRPLHLRLTYSSTTEFIAAMSLDGDTFITLATITVTAMTPTHGGWAAQADGTLPANRPLFSADYFHSNVTS